MKQHWDAPVGKKFPLSELARKRYIAAGGRLDRHDSVPYDHYIALLGTVPVSWGRIFFLTITLIHSFCRYDWFFLGLRAQGYSDGILVGDNNRLFLFQSWDCRACKF